MNADLTEGERSGSARLGEIDVANFDSSEHRLDLVIERDGEAVLDRSYDVAPKEDDGWQFVVERSWQPLDGTYSITARVDGQNEREKTISDDHCYDITVLVENSRIKYGQLFVDGECES